MGPYEPERRAKTQHPIQNTKQKQQGSTWMGAGGSLSIYLSVPFLFVASVSFVLQCIRVVAGGHVR